MSKVRSTYLVVDEAHILLEAGVQQLHVVALSLVRSETDLKCGICICHASGCKTDYRLSTDRDRPTDYEP